MLRDRVARALGPIVKYSSGPKAGQLVAPDIEAWFQQDKFQGQPHLVAQWADNHNGVARRLGHRRSDSCPVRDRLGQVPRVGGAQTGSRANPGTPKPQPADLAVVFFETFSKENPGKFPSSVTETVRDGKSVTRFEPVGAVPTSSPFSSTCGARSMPTRRLQTCRAIW